MANGIGYNPDILSCLANLSNDEVFTPPELANAVLDMIPEEFWSDPDVRVLDPGCKSGVFLREAAIRFIKGLENKIPDLQERIDHIFHKQLYGIAITELTGLLARRSLYCSKNAHGDYTVTSFKSESGNIIYNNLKHTWDSKGATAKCIYCGASKSEYDRDKALDQHAYEFIHLTEKKLQELQKVHFDLIIGNPPYQLSDGGGGAGKGASPLYDKFVEQAKKLKPRYLTMIIPSRWCSGGKGLDTFRQNMLADKHISQFVNYADSKTCFPGGVDIPGGICYFLWDANHDGKCKVANISKTGDYDEMTRSLDEFDTFIRNNNAVSIVKKALSLGEDVLSSQVSSRKPFGLESNTKFDKDGTVDLRSSSGMGKIKKDKILSGFDLIDKWKVIVSKVSFEHAGVPDKDGTMRVLSVVQKMAPNSACTESYLVAGSFDNETYADNFITYLKTKFCRFLLMQMLASMNMSKASYSFVPVQDYSKSWTDEELYKKYNLNEKEIEFIEASIRPMD